MPFQPIAPETRQCRGCGVDFVATDDRKWFHRKGCGRGNNEKQTNAWLLVNRPNYPTEPCRKCGNPVVQYRTRRYDSEMRYCGRSCQATRPQSARLQKAQWPPRRLGEYSNISKGCIDCGTGRRIGRCKPHRNQIWALKQKLRTRLVWLIPRTCARCGQNWNGWGSIARLCAECQKAGLLAHRTARRSKVKGGDNTISLKRVWQRDNGQCHICKQRTDLTSVWQDWKYWNEYMPKAPTVDHILALANGGAHTWENVALAHNECNAKKSDNLTMEGHIYSGVV
jgi:5-methylcytosine-specific restriction endonuclease McrA